MLDVDEIHFDRDNNDEHEPPAHNDVVPFVGSIQDRGLHGDEHLSPFPTVPASIISILNRPRYTSSPSSSIPMNFHPHPQPFPQRTVPIPIPIHEIIKLSINYKNSKAIFCSKVYFAQINKNGDFKLSSFKL